MVGGGEALIVESSGTAGGDDYALGSGDVDLAGFHVHENGAGALALVILDELDRGGEVEHGDASAEDLVSEGPHDLGTGVVLGRVHPLPGGAAAVGGDHGPVGGLVELDSELGEPLDGFRSFHDQLVEQVLLSGEVSAAVSVEEVLGGRIVGLVGSLDAALSHHGVRVSDPELGDDHGVGAGVGGLDGAGASGSAAADDEHVDVILGSGQIEVETRDAGLALEELIELGGDLLALVGADDQLLELIFLVIGMIGGEELFLLLGGHPAGVELDVLSSLGFDFLYRSEHFLILIHSRPPYFSISRVL